MKAEEYLKAARVREALNALQEQVRAHPADPRSRAFLFQLLAVMGQWDRAANQLKLLAELDAQTLALSRVYKAIVEAESLRHEILTGRSDPVIFGEPEPWMAPLIQGNKLVAAGQFSAGHQCLQAALEAAPEASVMVDGTASRWLVDADMRFGPMLEAMVDGRYFWIPFFRIRQLRMESPKHLRDLLWRPAGFLWTNGGESPGFVFARYPGTEVSTNGELLLSRQTEWQEKPGGLACGLGQRLLAGDADDFPILDVSKIELN